MSFSLQTTNLISELNEFSGGKIKNPDDIKIIIETSQLLEEKLFDDLIFKAKYLNGLGKIIHSGLSKIQKSEREKSSVQENSIDKVKNEYKINLQQFISILKELLRHSSPENVKIFGEKYLGMDQSSMVNLTTLIYDLTWLKKFKNSTKK